MHIGSTRGRQHLASMLSTFCLAMAAVTLVGGSHVQRTLPEGNLMLAYSIDCSGKVLQDAIDGVNVIVWFSIGLREYNNEGPLPSIPPLPPSHTTIHARHCAHRCLARPPGVHAPTPFPFFVSLPIISLLQLTFSLLF